MWFKRISMFLIVLFFMSGCATTSMKKWVEGDTFYSERMPAVRVKVKQDLKFVEKIHEARTPTDLDLRVELGVNKAVKIETAIFLNEQKRSSLIIRTSVFPPNANWYFNSFDYSNNDNILKHYYVMINGGRYAVGIFPWTAKDGSVYLTKIFGRNFGDQIKLELFYLEQVSTEWGNIRALNTNQDDFLKEFSKRADDSFEILAYSPRPTSTTSAPKTSGKLSGIDSAIATATN